MTSMGGELSIDEILRMCGISKNRYGVWINDHLGRLSVLENRMDQSIRTMGRINRAREIIRDAPLAGNEYRADLTRLLDYLESKRDDF